MSHPATHAAKASDAKFGADIIGSEAGIPNAAAAAALLDERRVSKITTRMRKDKAELVITVAPAP